MDGLVTLQAAAETDAMPMLFDAGSVRQQTLLSAIDCVGVGLHSGRRVHLTLRPAEPGTGIVIHRTDLGIALPAAFDRVADTRLCTLLASAEHPGVRVGTVEHVMAALAACGIDNAVLELDGPEMPVLDGSAAPFVFLIDCAGRKRQGPPRRVVEVLRPVRVQQGEAFAELRPAAPGATGLDLSLSIAFRAPAIGRQAFSLRLTEASFRAELAGARTFALREEIEGLRAAGLALGGSLDNAVVVDGERVLNPGGLRMSGEFVRHKLLDAVGDLALAGAPLRARFVGHCSGHDLNNRLLRALFAERAAWRWAALGWDEEREAA